VQTDRWQDDKGEPHSRTKVVGQVMQILDRKPEEPEVAAAAEPEAEG
jgi:single-stranded DNA-binding protein